MPLMKIIIERKIKPGKEEEFKQLMRELLARATHAEGFISGETLQSFDDPTLHVTISKWKSITAWNDWINSKERKAKQGAFDKLLVEPMKVTALRYE